MAENQKEIKKLKGLYLVPDPAMMKPHFGPSEHIKIGFRELSRHFDMEMLVLGNYQPEDRPSSSAITKGFQTRNPLIGVLRDVKLLLRSNRKNIVLQKKLGSGYYDFVYERGQYLDFRGVRLAKKAGIKHFYEVNWLNFLGIRQFYRSWFNPVAKKLEEWSYQQSDLNFFIGTQHRLIQIGREKVETIQNGIEREMMEKEKDPDDIPGRPLKLVYVANLMPHHRFDVLTAALHAGNFEGQIELHLVGYYFEDWLHRIPAGIKTILHGPVDRKRLPEILRDCQIGLISGGPSYSSFMKLFEYAAFSLCVISPDLENVKLMFDDDEIIYFETDNPDSMAEKLMMLLSDPQKITRTGNNFNRKVLANYTWDQVYEKVAVRIKDLSDTTNHSR